MFFDPFEGLTISQLETINIPKQMFKVMNCFAQDWTERGGDKQSYASIDRQSSNNKDERYERHDSKAKESKSEKLNSSKKESKYDSNREETNEIDDPNQAEFSNREGIKNMYTRESRKEEHGSSIEESKHKYRKKVATETDESNIVTYSKIEDDSTDEGTQVSNWSERETQQEKEDPYTKESNPKDSYSRDSSFNKTFSKKSTSEDQENTNYISIRKEVKKRPYLKVFNLIHITVRKFRI